MATKKPSAKSVKKQPDNQMAVQLLVLVGLGLLVIGFRLVTQSGTDILLQNDGYAVSGGAIIALAGFVLGFVTSQHQK